MTPEEQNNIAKIIAGIGVLVSLALSRLPEY